MKHNLLATLAAVAVGIIGVAPASAQWSGSGGSMGSAGLVSGKTAYVYFNHTYTGAYPAWPAASSTGVSHPYTWPAVPGALYLPGGYLGGMIPVNTFFAESAYGANCDNTLIETPSVTNWQGIGSGYVTTPASYACKVTAAPVVDMAWVHANLDAQGYSYYIAYPMVDHGNGRALITWVKGCWLEPYLEQNNDGRPFMCFQGMARLDGAGWTNQYAADSYCANPQLNELGIPTGACRNTVTRPYGPATINMALWSEPYRSTGALIIRWMAGSGNEIVQTYDANAPMLHPVQDDWLGGSPPPPPLPPAPSVANGPPPPPLNVGRSGNGYAQGQSGRISDGVQKDSGFDFVSFCNAPSNDGRPRSQAFIEACLAKAGQ